MNDRIAALMIGRGGSSLKNKNILPVHGHPLLLWSAAAARRSTFIGRYYMSSDSEDILSVARRAGYTSILRPPELATSTSQSSDVVRHALSVIEEENPVDIIVVQHANVGTITEKIIDDCVRELMADESLSSVVPCHVNNEYNPYRAKKCNDESLLEPFIQSEGPVSANRQDLPSSYFFDHSIWALRVSAIKEPGGQKPWDCMGNRIKPYLTSGCLDVHDLEDIEKTEKWITDNNIPAPDFKSE